MKENPTNKNCPYCHYDNIVAFVMKHTTSDRPVEEYIPVNFCPKCGANLTEYLNDRLTLGEMDEQLAKEKKNGSSSS